MPESPARAWHQVPEAGTVLALRFFIFWLRIWGRRISRLWLLFPALYFVVFNGNARRSSRQYLQRLGQPAGIRQVFLHVWHFAVTVMDRLYFVQDNFEPFEIEQHGHEHLEERLRQGRGAILLGAHLGSFEVMRCKSGVHNIPINIIGDFANADRLNAILRQINPNLDTRLISISDGGASVALCVQEAIERGELVGILGDRVRPGIDTAQVDFMGAKTRLPTGPYVLAAVLRCPIYFVAGLHEAPNRYRLYCEPFAEHVDLPRGDRKQAAAAYVQAYADQLEMYCRMSPYNWFNFFDFWPDAATAATTSQPSPRALRASEGERA